LTLVPIQLKTLLLLLYVNIEKLNTIFVQKENYMEFSERDLNFVLITKTKLILIVRLIYLSFQFVSINFIYNLLYIRNNMISKITNIKFIEKCKTNNFNKKV